MDPFKKHLAENSVRFGLSVLAEPHTRVEHREALAMVLEATDFLGLTAPPVPDALLVSGKEHDALQM